MASSDPDQDGNVTAGTAGVARPAWPTNAAVVGAGLMGRRIASVIASTGLDVRLTDVRPDVLDVAAAEAQQAAGDLASSRGQDTTPGRILAVPRLEEAVAEADYVTEAIIENVGAKNELFHTVRAEAPLAVLATNSSVLRISDIAAGVARPDLIVGTHWWNPPDLIPIVEVVQGEKTAPELIEWVMVFLTYAGKIPVWVRKDVPGYIGNRLQHALWREALGIVEAGVADAETVDLVVRNTIGLRLAQMGPLQNADYIGLDLTVAIHEGVLPHLDRSTAPNPLLYDLVASGQLGAKSGQGLVTWPQGRREEVRDALAAHVKAGLRAATEGA